MSGLVGLEPEFSLAVNYRRFAELEARGRSPIYEELAAAVAEDELILSFLLGLPPEKRQPNLLFAGARYLLDDVPSVASLRELITKRRSTFVSLLRSRRTQTNEPARCATLLPALAQIDGPIALLEVGASAGLTLLFDRYSYDFGGSRVIGLDPAAPTLECATSGGPPLATKVPPIVWRAGIDLHPLKVSDEDDMRWLHCLLWPGEVGREERLTAAIATARRDPPEIHQGDLFDDLSEVAAGAPGDATLVVFHSAVLIYVDLDKRAAFADAVRALEAVWLSNEGPGVVRGSAGAAPNGDFVLVRDGVELLARTDPHGTWIDWLGRESSPSEHLA